MYRASLNRTNASYVMIRYRARPTMTLFTLDNFNTSTLNKYTMLVIKNCFY